MKNLTPIIMVIAVAFVALILGALAITSEQTKLAQHKANQLEKSLRLTQDSLSTLKKEMEYQNKGYYTISPIDSQTVLVDGVMPVFTKDLEAFLYDEYYSINEHDYTAEW